MGVGMGLKQAGRQLMLLPEVLAGKAAVQSSPNSFVSDSETDKENEEDDEGVENEYQDDEHVDEEDEEDGDPTCPSNNAPFSH